MSYRCINGFLFAGNVWPGGCQVSDDDDILRTHLDNFAKVDEVRAVRTETASAAPGELRSVAKKAPAAKRPVREATTKETK